MFPKFVRNNRNKDQKSFNFRLVCIWEVCFHDHPGHSISFDYHGQYNWRLIWKITTKWSGIELYNDSYDTTDIRTFVPKNDFRKICMNAIVLSCKATGFLGIRCFQDLDCLKDGNHYFELLLILSSSNIITTL